LANLEVDPPVTIATLKVALLNEFCQDFSNFNGDALAVWHWSIKVEILEVDGAETCAWAREHAVKKKLDKFEGHGVGFRVAWEADAIAANCYVCAIRIIFFLPQLHTTIVWQISFRLWHGMSW
jgi:hypothetical protein